MADETKAPVAEKTAAETPAASASAPSSSGPSSGGSSSGGSSSGGSHAPHRSGPRDSRDSRGPRPGGPGGGREGGRKFFRRKKVCKFCVEKIESINYKDVRLLAGFVAESGKIVPRRLTGVCTPSVIGHQAGAQHRPAAVRRPLELKASSRRLRRCHRLFLWDFSLRFDLR
jgi:small subunit ribosomal protein S18